MRPSAAAIGSAEGKGWQWIQTQKLHGTELLHGTDILTLTSEINPPHCMIFLNIYSYLSVDKEVLSGIGCMVTGLPTCHPPPAPIADHV